MDTPFCGACPACACALPCSASLCPCSPLAFAFGGHGLSRPCLHGGFLTSCHAWTVCGSVGASPARWKGADGSDDWAVPFRVSSYYHIPSQMSTHFLHFLKNIHFRISVTFFPCPPMSQNGGTGHRSPYRGWFWIWEGAGRGELYHVASSPTYQKPSQNALISINFYSFITHFPTLFQVFVIFFNQNG